MIIPSIAAIATPQKEGSFNALAIDCPPTDNILTSEIAMVGEAPGEIEVLKGEPFVGPTGSQLNRICAAVRLARYKIYLTNACKAKFPRIIPMSYGRIKVSVMPIGASYKQP